MKDIYDRIFKKILTLSSTAVSNLINGLFDTDYPPDSTITYNWTEFESDSLKRTLADTILTINGHSYHLEAQMTEDESIIFRVFDYGYRHAELTATASGNTLVFPEPRIIYLYTASPAPDEYTLRLDFGTQGSFNYTVKTFKYLEASTEEINRKKMIILIPFSLLKLRDRLTKRHRGNFSSEELDSLKNLIKNDIMSSIESNYRLGNINEEDYRKLLRLVQKLFEHIYNAVGIYEEDVDMDMSIILPEDIAEMKQKEIDKLREEMEEMRAEHATEVDVMRAEIETLRKQLNAKRDGE